tara:strand:- start:1358 stop:1900 length:543 start_codon:yes stop_codon:yes gene_type:complete
MGLKQDLIDAKVKAAKESGIEEPLDTSNGSIIEREAEYIKEAIIKYITNCNFTITQLKAPIVVEDFKIPDQSVDVKMPTLLGDKAPIFKTMKKIAGMVPGAGGIVDQLEGAVKMAVKPLLKGGSTLPGPSVGKNTGLQSTGYVYIGDDPDSQNSFNVEDEDGQRQFTTVILNEDDARSNE